MFSLVKRLLEPASVRHEAIGKEMPKAAFKLAEKEQAFYGLLKATEEKFVKTLTQAGNDTANNIGAVVEKFDNIASHHAIEEGILNPSYSLKLGAAKANNTAEHYLNRLAVNAELNLAKRKNKTPELVAIPSETTRWIYEKGKIVGLAPKAPNPSIQINDETHILNSTSEAEKAFTLAMEGNATPKPTPEKKPHA